MTYSIGEIITDYLVAAEFARQTANATRHTCGIRKVKFYGKPGYVVGFIPSNPAKRFGSDFTCEVVEPDVTPVTDSSPVER